jgi:hypothetical protein
LVLVACFVTGFVLFPYSPIRQFGETYVGKGGHRYTAEDYRWYQQLEGIEKVAFAGCFLSTLYACAEYYRLTGSLRKPDGIGVEIWRKPKNTEITDSVKPNRHAGHSVMQ